MTSKVGRPPVPGEAITLRLSDASLAIMDAGVLLLASVLGQSPSRAAWFRTLIDSTFDRSPPNTLINAYDLRQTWDEVWLQAPLPHKVTMKIEEPQRVLLRQWECHVQSLDWTRKLYRNETCLILIESEGPTFNKSLSLSQKKPS